jgi:hypothetical protein
MPPPSSDQQRQVESPALRRTPRPVEQAAELFGWAGAVVRGVPLLGQVVDVVAQIDDDEHRRRIATGTGATLDYGVLDELANLPLNVPMRAEIGHRLARSRTSGVIDFQGESITRRAQRPCRVVGVLRSGGRWLDVIEQISLLAPLAARAVLLPARTAAHGAAALEAASLGVGLARCTEAGDDVRVEVIPKATTSRLSTGHWLMTETVYSTWLRQEQT